MIRMIVIICLSVLLQPNLLAQGCSDAGVCNLGGEYDTTFKLKNTLEVGYTYAIGLEDVIYNNGLIGYLHRWSNGWSGGMQVSYNQASGDFGTLGNVGDVLLTAQRELKTRKQSTWVVTFGTKVPLSTGNMKINDVPIPMEYQPSLGTLDALVSLECRFRKWYFEGAFQQPLIQSNRNSFFNEYSASNVFPTTNLLERRPDALFRGSYKWRSKNRKWTFKPNVMGIYHLGNDTFQDIKGERRDIEHSSGLTVNASWATSLAINDRKVLTMNLASPLVVRKIRPDGLTRALVASVSYIYHFN